jgi:hypothetical protein
VIATAMLQTLVEGLRTSGRVDKKGIGTVDGVCSQAQTIKDRVLISKIL